MSDYIHVYVPNLPHRKDRRVHIEQQYAERAEFNLHIVTPLAKRNSGQEKDIRIY